MSRSPEMAGLLALAADLEHLELVDKSNPTFTALEQPEFAGPADEEWPIPSSLRCTILPSLNYIVAKRRRSYVSIFRSTVDRMVTVEHFGGLSDFATTRLLIQGMERNWSIHIQSLKDEVLKRFRDQKAQVNHQELPGIKSAGFSASTISVLEAAYAKTQVLSQRECSLLAEAANITHQQVRTWFQNKRNREARRQRVTSQPVLPTSQPTPTPIRRIVSLPKRGNKGIAINAPPPVPTHEPTRPVRQLPRRAAAANAASYFETSSNDSSPSPAMTRTLSSSSEQSILSSSSLTSLSSVSSIHPTGGFASSLYPANSAGSTQVSFPIDLSPAASSIIGSSDPFLSGIELSFGPSTPLEVAVERPPGGLPHPQPAQLPGQPEGASAVSQWYSDELDYLLQTAAGVPISEAFANGPLAVPPNEVGSPESSTSSAATSVSSSELSTSTAAQSSVESQHDSFTSSSGQSFAPMGFEQMFGFEENFFASLDTLLHSSKKDEPSGDLLAQAENVPANITAGLCATPTTAPEQTGLVEDTSVRSGLLGQTAGPVYVAPELADHSPLSVRSSTYLVTPEISSLNTDDLELNQFQQIFKLSMGAAELPAATSVNPVMVPIPDLVSGALLDPSMIPLPQPTAGEAGCLGFENIERDLQASEQSPEGGVWDFSDLVNFE